MNDPVWDLAGLSVEARFGPEQDCAMMEAYYGAGPSPALYSRLEVYKAMGDLHWSLWGFVRHAKGNPAEDFWSYGLERLGRANARMSSADFGRHLGLVRVSSPTTFVRQRGRADELGRRARGQATGIPPCHPRGVNLPIP
jgi:hypothetical protein